MPRSIVGWFADCWGVFLVAAVAVGILLLLLYRESTVEQLRRASAIVTHGCDAVAARYQLFIAGASRPPANLQDPTFLRGLTDVVAIALRDLDGVEGGIWRVGAGSLAYAFPTYEGTGRKTDLPQAEEPSIQEVAEAAAIDASPADRQQQARLQALLLRACPLPGPIPQLSAAQTRTSAAGVRSAIFG